MSKLRQLYQQNNFVLPKISQIQYNPFKKQVALPSNSFQQQKYFDESDTQLKPTFNLAYNSQFQIIIGGQNMYPLFIEVTNDNLIVCSKDFFIIVKIDVHQDLNSMKQNLASFLKSNVKLGIYNKVMLSQTPSCLKAKDHHIYLGMADGKILCYDINRKSLTGTSDDFNLSIMQIQIIKENKIFAIDFAGNVKLIQFSHKTFLDKIIKTLVSAKDISIVYQVKKRQKIKKLFSNVINRKDQDENKNKNETQDKKQALNKQAQNPPYSYCRLSIPAQNLSSFIKSQIKLLVLCRKHKIQVITCNEESQVIHQSLVYEGQIDEIGMIEFGKGGFQNSNTTHLILVFSVKNQLLYYKGIVVQQSYDWVYISSTQFPNQILDGKFISNNLLLILTTKQVILCNVNEVPEKIHSFDIDKFGYIDFFVQQEGLLFDKKLIQKHILRIMDKKNEFFCLEGKRLLTGKIDSWKDYLQRYVEQQKFYEAMMMSLKIYNQELKKLAQINEKQQIRNKEMKEFFQRVALTYISYQIKKQNFDKQQMLSLCLHFLIKTESFQYLFTTIYQIFKSLNLEEQLLTLICKYAERGQIKVMTEQILDVVINWYKKKDQKLKLETIVQNFDLSMMDKSVLLIICLKEHLYQSMIYICNQHNDFISPILKLCGIYFAQELPKQQKNRIKQIVFFYLKQCLLGHRTEYGNSSAYIEMLIQVINFIFIPSTLDMLIVISCSDTIKIVNMFFQTKILQYILQNEGKFFIKKNDYVQMKIFEENCINEFKVYEKMLSTLIYIMDQHQQKNKARIQNQSVQEINQIQDKVSNKLNQNQNNLEFEVIKFLCFLIIKNQFPFQTKYKENCIYFFITTIKIQTFIGQQIGLQQEGSFHEDFLIRNQIQINAYFMRLMDSLMRSLQDKVQQKEKILIKILKKLQVSPNYKFLQEALCYVLHQLGNFSQTLKTYLKMKNVILKNKVFDFLDFNVNESSELSTQFIKSLSQLSELNKQKTWKMLRNLKQQFCDHQLIVENLHQFPDLQLEYIEEKLGINLSGTSEKNSNLLSSSLKNKFSLMHLQIVVKHKFHKLDEYIQIVDYPLEQAFKICESKGNKTATAFILIKNGRNMEGALMLCDVFLSTCDSVFRQLARKKQLLYDQRQKIYQQLEKVLQTCSKEFQTDHQRGQKIWEKCVRKIFKYLRISQTIRNESIPKQISEILKQIVYVTMKKMFSQMSPQFFMNKFCTKFKQLPFSVFIIGFGQLFDRMQFYNRLQFLEIQLLQEDEILSHVHLQKNSGKSHPVRSQCKVCLEKVSSSDQKQWSVLTYSCGCSFHKYCVLKHQKHARQNKQTISCCNLCMSQLDRLIELNGHKTEVYKKQYKKQTQIKRKIQRLKQYEVNQGKIFDLPDFDVNTTLLSF